MNISPNIEWILENKSKWCLVSNKSYKAKIQKADTNTVYNVPNMPGVVYNFLEDSYERVIENGYVVTGIMGEMWPIGEKALKKYKVDNMEITASPIEVDTVETGLIFAAIMIPKNIQFTLEVDYGERALLKGNRIGIDHYKGDYILVTTKYENGLYIPDFSDNGRIVNGRLFNDIYKEINII